MFREEHSTLTAHPMLMHTAVCPCSSSSPSSSCSSLLLLNLINLIHRIHNWEHHCLLIATVTCQTEFRAFFYHIFLSDPLSKGFHLWAAMGVIPHIEEEEEDELLCPMIVESDGHYT